MFDRLERSQQVAHTQFSEQATISQGPVNLCFANLPEVSATITQLFSPC